MTWQNFFSPSLKIAGGRALLWGLSGLAVSVAAATFNGFHAYGLLNFGPGPRDAAYIAALEYLIIWLVPAAIFYGFGSALSRSCIRPLDIFGTTAFALMPLAVTNLMQLMPGLEEAYAVLEEPVIDIPRMMEVVMQPLFILHLLVLMAMFVLMLIWLFNAVKVSCNLKGGRLWAVYLVGIIGGDLICKQLIKLIY
jgi:hypothetical protein